MQLLPLRGFKALPLDVLRAKCRAALSRSIKWLIFCCESCPICMLLSQRAKPDVAL
jgi:hypothetical protein